METILSLIILACLTFFIIGLFSPRASLFWDKKNKPTRKKSALLYGIVLIASFFVLGATVDQKKAGHSDTAASVDSVVAETKPSYTQAQLDSIDNENVKSDIKEREDQTITAPALTASYEENEVKADGNFKGKTFFVEGTVMDIKKDIMDDIYVILEGDQMFRNVQCFFNDKKTAAQLEKGMRVTFKGSCDGLMINVLMKNCVLVDNLSTMKKQLKK